MSDAKSQVITVNQLILSLNLYHHHLAACKNSTCSSLIIGGSEWLSDCRRTALPLSEHAASGVQGASPHFCVPLRLFENVALRLPRLFHKKQAELQLWCFKTHCRVMVTGLVCFVQIMTWQQYGAAAVGYVARSLGADVQPYQPNYMECLDHFLLHAGKSTKPSCQPSADCIRMSEHVCLSFPACLKSPQSAPQAFQMSKVNGRGIARACRHACAF